MFGLPVLVLLLATPLAAQATDAPGDVQAVFSKAVQLLNAGHYAEAVPLLEDVTSRAPDRPGGFMNLGLAAAESGDHHLALQAWSRYHELVPNFTLTSGDVETSVARQLGEIGKDDRIYALDRNEGTTSSLYGMLTTVSVGRLSNVLPLVLNG